MSNMQQYRVRILDHDERLSRPIVKSYKFESMDVWKEPPLKDMPEGRIPILICKCGGGEFTMNGRSINEYECPCCSEFIELSLED